MGARTHRGFARLRKLLLGTAMLVTLDVAFAALTVNEIITPSLGTVFSGVSGRNFILNTDETVTGADAADYLFGAVSGQIEIRKTAGPQDANIVAENITTLGGVAVNAVPCRFDSDPQTTCDGAGITVRLQAAKILFVGVDITTTQVHSGGDPASASYDIAVNLL